MLIYMYIYMTIYELFLIFKLNFQLKIFVKKQPTRQNGEFNINYVWFNIKNNLYSMDVY